MYMYETIKQFPGQVGFYARRLTDGAVLAFGEDRPLVAASVIKVPILVSAMLRARDGLLDLQETYVLKPEDKMPSCGALNCLHDGLRLTLEDLAALMIILSDNTATNVLIDRLGMQAVNEDMAALGIQGAVLRRRLFDAEASARGIQNTVTARGIGLMLERMVRRELLGGDWDERMLRLLGRQRLNGKLPFFLHSRGIDVLHKTGEDEGITHDCGIVLSPEPFVLCMLSNDVDVPAFERLMQDAALRLAEGHWNDF